MYFFNMLSSLYKSDLGFGNNLGCWENDKGHNWWRGEPLDTITFVHQAIVNLSATDGHRVHSVSCLGSQVGQMWANCQLTIFTMPNCIWYIFNWDASSPWPRSLNSVWWKEWEKKASVGKVYAIFSHTPYMNAHLTLSGLLLMPKPLQSCHMKIQSAGAWVIFRSKIASYRVFCKTDSRKVCGVNFLLEALYPSLPLHPQSINNLPGKCYKRVLLRIFSNTCTGFSKKKNDEIDMIRWSALQIQPKI